MASAVEWPLTETVNGFFAEAAKDRFPPDLQNSRARGRRPLAPAIQLDRAVSSANACGPHHPVELFCTCYPQPSPGAGFGDERPEGLRSKPVFMGKHAQRNHLAEGKAMRRKGKVLSQKAKLFVAT